MNLKHPNPMMIGFIALWVVIFAVVGVRMVNKKGDVVPVGPGADGGAVEDVSKEEREGFSAPQGTRRGLDSEVAPAEGEDPSTRRNAARRSESPSGPAQAPPAENDPGRGQNVSPSSEQKSPPSLAGQEAIRRRIEARQQLSDDGQRAEETRSRDSVSADSGRDQRKSDVIDRGDENGAANAPIILATGGRGGGRITPPPTAGPQATPTPAPNAPTPGPEATPAPDATATPAETSTPVPEPTRTPQPEPTITPAPTQSATPEATPSPTPEPGRGALYLEPGNTVANAGRTFTLNFWGESPDKPLGGYNALIEFDPAMLSVHQFRQGLSPLLGYPFVLQIMDEDGLIVLSSFQGSSFDEPTGRIHLGYIDFKALAAGQTEIKMLGGEMANVDAQDMTMTHLGGTKVTINAATSP